MFLIQVFLYAGVYCIPYSGIAKNFYWRNLCLISRHFPVNKKTFVIENFAWGPKKKKNVKSGGVKVPGDVKNVMVRNQKWQAQYNARLRKMSG